MEIYVVQPGDTIYSIARRFGVSAQKLSYDNGVGEDGALAVGQSITVLFPDRTYTLQNEQSAQSVAQNNGISAKMLYRNNIFLGGAANVPQGAQVVINYLENAKIPCFLGGYAYDFISQRLLDSVISYMTYLMPFTYGFTESGELIAPDDGRLIDTAYRYDVKPLMHLSTLTQYGNFSSSLADAVLNDPQSTQNLVNNVLNNVIQKGYYGVDVDFEYLPAADRDNYTNFISQLTREMNNNGYICVVAVPPKISDTQTGTLYEGVDYAGLGEAADYVFLMTYEWGYRFGPPLPVAPVPSVRRVIDYALSRIPSEKLILGISNYGYDWTLPFVQGESDAPSLSTETAIELAIRYGAEIQFDEENMAPYFYYTDEFSRAHVVWFEDARSYAAKCALIEEYDLAGGFIWDLMRRNPQGYVTLNSLLEIK